VEAAVEEVVLRQTVKQPSISLILQISQHLPSSGGAPGPYRHGSQKGLVFGCGLVLPSAERINHRRYR
jgi:hypothetical protein